METDVVNNIRNVLRNLPEDIQLVAVSKFHSTESIEKAYSAGQRVFGESHEQELKLKKTALPQDICWHFIGHLQTNKVKYIAPYIDMIEAVDSFKLMKEINKQAQKNDRVIDILLELHIAAEETKYGFTLNACRLMASNVDDEEQICKEMLTAANFFDEIKRDFFADMDYFKERSWGMSHDYLLAVSCRSTMVRVGSAIFGTRVY